MRVEEAAGSSGSGEWGRAGRIAARLARHVEVGLSEVDLSLSQYRLLMFLSDRAAVASKLADYLAVTRPSITAVVDGLVARGLVERRQCADDRRRVEHILTQEGRRLLDAADESVDARLAEVASHFPDERDAADSLAALRRWRPALEAFGAARMARKSERGEGVVEAKA